VQLHPETPFVSARPVPALCVLVAMCKTRDDIFCALV
jgi:hypothetical protein